MEVAVISRAFATLNRMFGMGSPASWISMSRTLSRTTSSVRDGTIVWIDQSVHADRARSEMENLLKTLTMIACTVVIRYR